MAEESLLAMVFTLDFAVALALRSVISGLILFGTSRLVGAKGGLLSAMGVATLTTLITIFLFEAYVFPLIGYEATDILTAIKTNLFGLILSYVLPSVVWFFVVMMLLKVGPFQALTIAFAQWLISLALSYFGVLTFLTDFL